MKKTYYHVSRDVNNIIEKFTPRTIGASGLPGEDRTIPRVCLCLDMHSCLNGVYYTHDNDCHRSNRGYKRVRFYEFELEETDVLPPEQVQKYVADALKTRECWSLKEIKPTKSYIIKPTWLAQEDKYPFYIVDWNFDLSYRRLKTSCRVIKKRIIKYKNKITMVA